MTVGSRCPYCQSRSDLDDPVRCPSCGAICHRDCWLEYGGCAVPGCSSGATAAISRPPPPNPPPPLNPPPPPNPPPGWFPDPHGSGRQRWWSGTAWTDHLHPPPAS